MLRMPHLLLCLLVAASAISTADAAPDQSLVIPREAQAILDRHCVKCHGPLEQNGGLWLDSAVGIGKGGENGPVVVLGKPEGSKLVDVLAANAELHMPP